MEQIGAQIIRWYRRNKRSLPWRETRDPYRIWLSEIILQQTRVEQGLPYFLKFIKEFKNVHALANASQQKVLKCWEGLGYYSRARNLHFTAKYVSKSLRGKFPPDHAGLLKLKGVGPYTAAAISSICYEEPKAVVDGNVYRVLSRIFGIKTPSDSTKGKKLFNELAQELLGKHLPSEFNQAMMEFGARYCKPSSPDCPNCILHAKCYAGSRNQAALFPVKEKKTTIRSRHLYYFILNYKNKLLIQERMKTDIWKGLYEFPLIETAKSIQVPTALRKFLLQSKIAPGSFSVPLPPSQRKHLLSHRELQATCFYLVLHQKPSGIKTGKWVERNKIDSFPFPRLLLHFVAGLP